MTGANWIILVVAILGVLHGPLPLALVRKMRQTKIRATPAAAVPGYAGIRLRICTPDGVILDVDSDELHDRALRRNWDGWSDLIAGGDAGTTEFSTVPLKIEVKAIGSPNRRADEQAS